MNVDTEIERIRRIVGKYFAVTEVVVGPEALTLQVFTDPATLDERFDKLRRELVPQHFIPSLRRDPIGFAIVVQRRPPTKTRGARINAVLLAFTVVTTTLSGMLLWANYVSIDWLAPEALAFGVLFFALPLMAMIGIHEMGHYVVSKRHGVDASLPFFIPSIPPLGTLGAVISMRDPIPNRRALLEIGISGPLAGLAVALPIALAGLWLTATTGQPLPADSTEGGQAFVLPLVYEVLNVFIPIPTNVAFHPMAFAGWVGLFVTALNLLPAGQLDGGHVARAVLGERAHYVSFLAVGTMLLLGLVGYPGWFIIALFILLTGARHPPPLNDITKLDRKRLAIGLSAALVLALTFVPFPIVEIPREPGFVFDDPAAPVGGVTSLNVTAVAGQNNTASFLVNNTGNVRLDVTLTFGDAKVTTEQAKGWRIGFSSVDNQPVNGTQSITFRMNASSADAAVKDYAVVAVYLDVPVGAECNGCRIDILGTAEGVSPQRLVLVTAP